MTDKSNISIFQGSTVEADTVHDYLAQQGIASLVRNHMQETLDAGWLTADPEHAAEVFVAVEDEKRAVDLLRNLFSEDTAVPASGVQAQGNATIVVTPATPSEPGLRDRAAVGPMDLPRIISLPTIENRSPANAPTAPSERPAAEGNAEFRPTPPPAPDRF